MSKTISHDDYLKAYALFTMARQHAEEAERYNKSLAKLLDVEQYSEFADQIWDHRPPHFHAALEKAGIRVLPSTQEQKP